jgi:pimeloyl-ACP methyl ester carboxylesterase
MNFIFFHGNPGFPEDFKSVWQKFRSPPAFIQKISDSPEPYVAVAYSFGAFRALNALERGERPPAALVLVAPFVKSSEPLSGFAKLLMKSPLKGFIVGKKYPQFREDLLTRMFSNDERGLAADFLQKTDKKEVWEQVITDKLWQEDEPLQKSWVRIPTLVVTGSEDRISPPAKVKRDLEPLIPQFQYLEIPGASHGLPWTHSKVLAEAIESFSIKGPAKEKP